MLSLRHYFAGHLSAPQRTKRRALHSNFFLLLNYDSEWKMKSHKWVKAMQADQKQGSLLRVCDCVWQRNQIVNPHAHKVCWNTHQLCVCKCAQRAHERRQWHWVVVPGVLAHLSTSMSPLILALAFIIICSDVMKCSDILIACCFHVPLCVRVCVSTCVPYITQPLNGQTNEAERQQTNLWAYSQSARQPSMRCQPKVQLTRQSTDSQAVSRRALS